MQSPNLNKTNKSCQLSNEEQKKKNCEQFYMYITWKIRTKLTCSANFTCKNSLNFRFFIKNLANFVRSILTWTGHHRMKNFAIVSRKFYRTYSYLRWQQLDLGRLRVYHVQDRNGGVLKCGSTEEGGNPSLEG